MPDPSYPKKLWLDDKRRAPDETWFRARSFDEAVNAVLYRDEPFDIISLDHDLSEYQPTGYDFIRWLVFHLPDKLPQTLRLHTDNPVGRNNMEAIITSSGKYPHRELFGLGYTKEVD